MMQPVRIGLRRRLANWRQLAIERPKALILALLPFLSLAGGCGPNAPVVPERVIFILVDTLRADYIGSAGGPVPTPHLDRLAAEGQLLSRAVASFNVTSMSMGAIFSGETPSLETLERGHVLPWSSETFCGLSRFATEGDRACVPAAIHTLGEFFSEAGFETLGIVSNPLVFRPYGFDQGFDSWHEVGVMPEDSHRTSSKRKHAERRTGKFVNEKIRLALRERSSDHFFLYVHYLDAHDYLLLGHGYNLGIEKFDGVLGELLSILEAEKLLENSVVVLTADHGESLGEEHPIPGRPMHFGNPSYDSVLKVPLIIRPALLRDTTHLLRGQDLRDLLIALAIGKQPTAPESERELFITEASYQTYRRGRWKSIWPRSGDPAVLFDLEADPEETRDQAAAHREVMDDHRARIDDLVVELSREAPESDSRLSEEDRERLRVLGYLEEHP